MDPGKPLTPSPIKSIQPGGGWCFNLERKWGQLRRFILRRFFPSYVKSMEQHRQGTCPGCPHNIVDGRDLKLFRNVCGYSFPSDVDRFRWRGRLGLARAGLAELLISSLILLPCIVATLFLAGNHHPIWLVPAAILAAGWIFILSFFRDPERVIPGDPTVLVSPADGVITHLEEVQESGLAGDRCFRVSIFLSVFNVHVNRMPRSGTLRGAAYYPGEYLDARDQQCAVRNEQLWLDFEDEQLGFPFRVKQIAGAIARRIVFWVREGESLSVGDRFGMIKFGSRTDVLLPANRVAEIKVRVGQAVKGGKDVLLTVHANSSAGS